MTNVEVRVRSSYSALSPTCQKAADYLLAHTRELYSCLLYTSPSPRDP